MKTQTQIVDFLEGLVHQRYNLEQLEEIVSKFFNQDVVIENTSSLSDDELTDFNLMFNIEDGTEQSGYYDIYMLPMRRKGFGGEDMYITEVGYEFI